jgi:hypothetical protein
MKKITKTIRKIGKLTIDKETLRQIAVGDGPKPTTATSVVSECPPLCSNIADTCV